VKWELLFWNIWVISVVLVFQSLVSRVQTPTQKTWRRTFPALLCYMYLTPQWIVLGLVQRQPTEKTTATGYRSRTYFLRCVEQSLIKDINMKITAWYTKPGDQKPQFKERQTIQWARVCDLPLSTGFWNCSDIVVFFWFHFIALLHTKFGFQLSRSQLKLKYLFRGKTV
jgi:hypothetical protein